MGVRQYYYTSYVDEKAGHAGFQIKAMSPGLSPELQATLARLIAYRIPPALAMHEVTTHPVALRYHREGSGECILLCSQSSGNDEYGRPGNFFAHALVMERDTFTSVPPIFFWKSSFWRAKDPEKRSHIASLPVLPSFNEEPSLHVEDIWNFLAQNNRRALLYKLLCAVVHSSKTRRRIVIIDSAEHVALWIAAISCLLPPAYRPLLTFATYHHDPYQAHYFITGTTSGSSFRASPEDSLSFFILNAETGFTSAIETSLYAELAARVARPALYETVLLPIFTNYARYFSMPTVIDEQLDILALYIKIQDVQHRDRLTSGEIAVMMDSIIAVTSGQMTSERAEQLRYIVAHLQVEEYRAMIERSIPEFFCRDVSHEAHLRLIQILFSGSHHLKVTGYFWQVYLRVLFELLQRPTTVKKAIALLDFWFATSPRGFTQGYPVQQFFLLLSTCEKLQQSKNSQEMQHVFHAAAAHRPWYPSMCTLFPGQQTIFKMLGQQVMARWQTHIQTHIQTYIQTYIKERNVGKKPQTRGIPEHEIDIRTFESIVSNAFEEGEFVEWHRLCSMWYVALSSERFWSCYWNTFTRLLVSCDAEQILSVLSFWFDQSDDVQNAIPYMLPEFFLGLYRTLSHAARIPGFHETAHAVHEWALHNGSYPWYSLVAHYFYGGEQ